MKIIRSLFIPLIFSFTTGCTSSKEVMPTESVGFEFLIRQIKFDIGTYYWRHKDDKFKVPKLDPNISDETKQMADSYEGNVKGGAAQYANPGQKCLGQVNISIEKVKVSVTAVSADKTGANAGLEIPVGLATLNPSASLSQSRRNTITTVIEFAPGGSEIAATEGEEGPPLEEPTPSPQFVGTPISDALDRLGNDLVATSSVTPCFKFDGTTPAKLTWGFEIIRSAEATGKFKLLFFSLGSDASVTRSAANTVEVSFMPVGGFN